MSTTQGSLPTPLRPETVASTPRTGIPDRQPTSAEAENFLRHLEEERSTSFTDQWTVQWPTPWPSIPLEEMPGTQGESPSSTLHHQPAHHPSENHRRQSQGQTKLSSNTEPTGAYKCISRIMTLTRRNTSYWILPQHNRTSQ